MLKLFLWLILILIIKILINKFNDKSKVQNGVNNTYFTRQLMTRYERYFYDILIELKDELNIEIMPQVNLATIINKEGNYTWRNELFKNIDFGIFSKDYEKLLLLIEINDKTHNNYSRRQRDIKVDNIVNNAGIKLIKFYSSYPNKKDYVKNRVRDEINNIIGKM